MNITKKIPSVITTLNLLLGCLAIFLNHNFYSPVLILFAMILDISDGLAARLLNAQSAFGKELDSLADMVSFGIAPAFMFYQFYLPKDFYGMAAASFIPVFSAIRLAVFNTDPEQVKIFKGLPTPASAIFFCSFFFITREHPSIMPQSQWFYMMFPPLIGYLLVCPLRMFSFKDITKPFKSNPLPYIFLILVALMIVFLGWMTIPCGILLYILLSLAGNMFRLI